MDRNPWRFTVLAVVFGSAIAACSSGSKGTDIVDPGPPENLVANSNTTQNATIGNPVSQRPSVVVTDADGNGVPDVQVTFAVTGGGGSITGAVQTTNAVGVATVGSWTMGAAAGANTLTATSDGLNGSPITFTANATATTSNFTVKLTFTNGSTPAQAAAFNAAKARWEAVVTGDLTDFLVNSATTGGNPDVCDTGVPVNETVDDVLIQVVLDSIDGPGQVLGAAGPCVLRPTSVAVGDNLTIVGQMTFDTADVQARINDGSFTDIVLHEMGHVLGIGSLWQFSAFNFVTSPCTTNPRYTGTQAITAYTGSNGGGASTSIPLENFATGGCNNGTRDSHWEEDVFGNELMTGFISGTTRPMSLTTVRSLADFGYTVDNSQADAFTIPGTPFSRSPLFQSGPFISLHGDVRQGPIYVMSDRPGAPMVRVR